MVVFAVFKDCKNHGLIELLCVSVFLEKVLETELNNARIDACAGNLPKRRIPYRSIGISELRSIEGVVKLGPELEIVAFTYRGVFDDGNIPVMLAGTGNYAYTGISVAVAVAVDSACRRVAERTPIEVSVQSIADASRRQDIVVGHIETHLRSATGRPINSAGGIIRKG